MPRPKKEIDEKRAEKLKKEGYSTREIAKEMGVSQPTIWRVLNHLFKTDSKPHFTSKKSDSKPSDSKPDSKLIQNSSDVKVENRVKPARTSESMHTRTPTPLAPTTTVPLGTAHHLLFVLSYAGKQPMSIRSAYYGNNKKNRLSLFQFDNYVIEIHKNRVKVWCNSIDGDTTKEMLDRAYGKARAILGKFAFDKKLTLDWKSFEPMGHMHITFKKEHKDIDQEVLGVIKEEPERAKNELGMLAGDSSHPNQTEFIGKEGESSFDNFSWLLREFPKDWKAEREVVKEFAENFKSHFAMIQELRDTMKEIKKANVEMREYIKKLSEPNGKAN